MLKDTQKMPEIDSKELKALRETQNARLAMLQQQLRQPTRQVRLVYTVSMLHQMASRHSSTASSQQLHVRFLYRLLSTHSMQHRSMWAEIQRSMRRRYILTHTLYSRMRLSRQLTIGSKAGSKPAVTARGCPRLDIHDTT